MSEALDEEMRQPAASTSQRQDDPSPSSGRTPRQRNPTVFYQTAASSSPSAHIARTTSQQRRLERRREARAEELAEFDRVKLKNEDLERQLRAYQTREGGGTVDQGVAPVIRKERIIIEISSDDETPEANPPLPAPAPFSPTASDIEMQHLLRPTVKKTFKGSKKTTTAINSGEQFDGERFSRMEKGKGKMRERVEERDDRKTVASTSGGRGDDRDEIMWIAETDDECSITTPNHNASKRTAPAILDAVVPNAKDRHKSHQFSSKPYDFELQSHLPRRKPLDAEVKRATGALHKAGSESAIRDVEIQRRIAVQRTLSELGKDDKGLNHAGYRLESIGEPLVGKEKMARCVEFFPFAYLRGLEYMEGVYASIFGNKVGIFRLASNDDDTASSDDRRDGSRIRVKVLQSLELPILASPSPQRREMRSDSKPDSLVEDYHSLAWSIDCSHYPFVPILAVAGEAAVINVYRNEISQDSVSDFILDRSITGHGRRINHLTFAEHHPHVLISASEDATICLWDVTLPWGSNLAVTESMDHLASRSWETGQHFIERPRVVGELLAKLMIGGHMEGVLSCDLHSELPLLVSSGTDGAIKVWEIPSSILVGPNLSTMTVLPPRRRSPSRIPPSAPPTLSHEPLILGPPIFSSTLVHAGAWVDQVKWKSSCTTEIISKASKIHSESTTMPRTSVKIFQPKILDLFPLLAGDEDGERTIREIWDRKKGMGEFLPAIKDHGALAFDTLREITMEGTNCIGASFGHFEGGSSNLIILGSFLDNSTYFFTDSTATSLVDSEGTVGLSTVESTFPESREPFELNFWPRLFPSSITDLTDRSSTTSVGGEGSKGVIWRHFGISREGQWIVAVGDQRSVAIWRRCTS